MMPQRKKEPTSDNFVYAERAWNRYREIVHNAGRPWPCAWIELPEADQIALARADMVAEYYVKLSAFTKIVNTLTTSPALPSCPPLPSSTPEEH